MALAVVLLAAGGSSRMRGRDKLLEQVNGIELLRHLALEALAAGLGPVAVTLRPDAPGRSDALAGLGLTTLLVPDADEGMAASLRTAARWALATGAEGLMVTPADLPELTARDFATLASTFTPDGPPLRATAQDGTPGHPVLFPAHLLPEFATLTGDRGAQPVLLRHPPRLVALPASHATTDLDTPEDWSAWRNR
ncbi:MAG: nucleotidyltransferase family protein [Pararhodobacter sp.]|nr:nucleotidyltransferase family protein [Pararhodobacter sp.]